MNMLGGPDPLYVRARAALLDATDALVPFLDAMVLVGAQAVYLRAGDAGLMVAEYTTNADFAFDRPSCQTTRFSRKRWSPMALPCGDHRGPG